MPIKKLLKESKIDPSDTVEFYHISDDVHFMKDFLDNGAKAIGKGVGGQKTGFYVFPTRKKAEKHISFKDTYGRNPEYYGSDFSKDGGLLVGVRIPKQLIQYPDWEIDYEGNEVLIPLFAKYQDAILNTKDFTVQTDDGEIKHYSIVRANPVEEAGRSFKYQNLNNDRNSGYFHVVSDGGTIYTPYIQGLCGTLCKNNPEFRKDYNLLLKKVVQSGKASLKYTGEKPLTISHLSLIQTDTKGKFEETVLYTDQKPKEKQVCPFVTAGLKIKASQKQ